MTITRQQITLNNVRLYAYHGVMEQERVVGGWYEVTLSVDYPFERALATDSIGDTINYAALLDLVRCEMAVPSRLIEHVAGRILQAVVSEFPLTEAATVQVTKLNPPFGAKSNGATVSLSIKKQTGDIRKNI